jgi:hypothetical protein
MKTITATIPRTPSNRSIIELPPLPVTDYRSRASVRTRRHVENPQFSWRPVEEINPRPTFNGPQRKTRLSEPTQLKSFVGGRSPR